MKCTIILFLNVSFVLPGGFLDVCDLQAQTAWKPIDLLAKKETHGLYYNLHQLAKKHILFGHQGATDYGHGWGMAI